MRKNESGDEIYSLIKKLYPICRSITGNGVRKTLGIIKDIIPINIYEVPSGTKVFDWVVPKEWNIHNAYIKNLKGKKILDFNKSNLYVLGYSLPIKKKIKLAELKKNLYTLPKYPNWIPYLTSYYNPSWGFCLSQKEYLSLKDEEYEVCIDSTLENGSLTYGELFIQGDLKQEILLSTYLCHPSLCNDNLSGVGLLTYLAKYLMEFKPHYSYRILFIPETIGAITWLSLNKNKIQNIKYGLVVTCVGDPGNLTYKKTRDGNSELDQIVKKVLDDSGEDYNLIDFFPSGSDERQFSSPGINIQVGSLMRTIYGKYEEYHTSADNLSFIESSFLDDSFKKYKEVLYLIENNNLYLNLNPQCEPNLGTKGIYSLIGGNKDEPLDKLALFWILNLSDGTNSLLDISIKAKIKFSVIKNTADILSEKGLIK
ncbi:peptidase M28, partial [Candidatus Pacearchaeota archaeon CG10_big_fil_rev_8_21_14_0_10_32_42]